MMEVNIRVSVGHISSWKRPRNIVVSSSVDTYVLLVLLPAISLREGDSVNSCHVSLMFATSQSVQQIGSKFKNSLEFRVSVDSFS